MGKLDALWAYQKTDMEVSRFENEMRRDPTRNKLLRLRNFVTDQQKLLHEMEEKSSKAQGRVEAIQKSYKEQEDLIADGSAKMAAGGYQTLQEVQSALREGQRLLEGLKSIEREIKSIVAEAESAEEILRGIRQKVAEARTQYNKLKEGYDKTFAQQTEQLNAFKAKRAEAGKDIDEALLARYEAIKKQYTQQPVPQPMAQLLGDQCGGCNMSLPAVVTRRVRDDASVVECENCGRMLYLPE